MREAALEIARQSNTFAPSLADQLVDGLVKPIKHLAETYTLERLKAQLRRLDDHQLNDIGLTRSTLEDLKHDSFGPRGAIRQMRTDLRFGKTTADVGSLRRETVSCGWTCTAR